jgi:heparanase 1
MNNDNYIQGARLDSNFKTSQNWTGTLNQYFGGSNLKRTMQMWAGEIGPSIGGSGDCTDNYHRFNGFSDGFWYLDSLGVHAQTGYQVFCRQDFYGIDYALLDCAGHFPVPDYYTAMIWDIVAGTNVFNTTRPITKPDGSVRPYAHCSKQYPGGLTVILINILDGVANTQVTLTSGTVGNTRYDYLLTAPPEQGYNYSYPVPQNIYDKKVQLNGKNLDFTVGGQLPPLTPVTSTASDKSIISLPAYSYGFFVFPDANLALCK